MVYWHLHVTPQLHGEEHTAMEDPAGKAPKVVSFLESMMGRTTALEQNRCISFCCGRQIDLAEFSQWSEQQLAEYRLSAMCNHCQDAFFEPECNGQCYRSSDIGVPTASDPVAYAHPDCPLHG